MSQASLTADASGVLNLTGVLDYRSGPALREQGQKLIDASAADRLVVDCSAVQKSSSVGVSLLLAYSRDAKVRGKALAVRGLPNDMRQIAEVCGISGLLLQE